MTKAEQTKMRRLEIRVDELEKALCRITSMHGREFRDCFEARYAMRCAIDDIEMGLQIMRDATAGKAPA